MDRVLIYISGDKKEYHIKFTQIYVRNVFTLCKHEIYSLCNLSFTFYK